MLRPHSFLLLALAALLPAYALACAADTEARDALVPPSGSEEDDDAGARPRASSPSSETESETEETPERHADAGPDGSAPGRGLSTGCGKAPGAKGLSEPTLTIGGKVREYLKFVPTGYDANEPMSLVIGLHGMTGTSEKARSMFGLEAKAAGKAIFVYPQALVFTEGEFAGKTRWNFSAGSGDHAFLEALADAIEESYCIDRDRVFLVGFSNGAEMTAMAGCYHGDRYRAIAALAPGGLVKNFPLSRETCVGEVAAFTGVGTEDASHQAVSAHVRDHYRTANGCGATRTATTPTGCEAYRGCRADAPTTWCTWPAGHTWPSFGGAGVWGFFAALP